MNIRHQTLILIIVVIGSLYLFNHASVFSSSSKTQQAQIIGVAQTNQNETSTQQTETLSPTPNKNITSQDTIPVPQIKQPQTAKQENPTVTDATPTTCPLQAKIFMAKDLNQGTVILGQNINQRWPIASISKLMTTVIASENMSPTTTITITQEMIDATQGNAYFAAGQKYTVSDLIRAALVFSSNDAAYALADTYGRAAFVAKMNQKAQDLLMTQTSYFEPSGLSYLNQSTAQNLSLLMRYIYAHHPELLAITRMRSITLHDLASGKNKTFSNIDYFAGNAQFIGGKTGYIDQSGENLITLFTLKGGNPIMLLVLSSPDRFTETQQLLSCAEHILQSPTQP